MGLAPLPDCLTLSCSHASSSQLTQPYCWSHSTPTGASSKFKPNHTQFCRSNQVALNPDNIRRSARLQSWQPNATCSVAVSSDSTTFPSKSNGTSRNFLLKEATKLSNVTEERGAVPIEGDPGKIFVGNLPYRVRREDVKEFFAQCGPVRDIIFIRSHDDPQKNKGFCFLFFGGPDPNAAAIQAADLDGAEFFGKLLTVKIDDGRWERDRREQRERWVESGAVFFFPCKFSALHILQ